MGVGQVHGQNAYMGWRTFIEGIISEKVVTVQEEFVGTEGCKLSLENWAKGFLVRLLEAMHEQWL